MLLTNRSTHRRGTRKPVGTTANTPTPNQAVNVNAAAKRPMATTENKSSSKRQAARKETPIEKRNRRRPTEPVEQSDVSDEDQG